MADGPGDEALYMGPGEGPGEGALLAPPLGGGDGTRKEDSSLSGEVDGVVFFSAPGAFAVFMLE